MKTIGTIGILALLLGGFATTAAAQDDCHTFDRARGECSPGTQAPTREALVNAIRTMSPTRLMGMLEYGEQVECYECGPLLVDRILTDDNDRMREFSAWYLRRRHLMAGYFFRELRMILEGTPSEWATSGERDYTQPIHRARAAEALGEFLDPNALEPLQNAARNDSEDVVRAAAVSALGRLNHPLGNPTIAAALADRSADVRRAAVMVIPRVNFFREHDALLGTLADDDVQVRRQGALLVGQLRVAEAVDALAGLLRADADASVRRSAAWSLGRIGTPAARAALDEALGVEEVSMVRDAIEIGLQM